MTKVPNIEDFAGDAVSLDDGDTYLGLTGIPDIDQVAMIPDAEYSYFTRALLQNSQFSTPVESSPLFSPKTVFPVLHKRPKRHIRLPIIPLPPIEEDEKVTSTVISKVRRSSTGSSGGRLIYPDNVKRSRQRRLGSFYGLPAIQEVKAPEAQLASNVQSSSDKVLHPRSSSLSSTISRVSNYVQRIYCHKGEAECCIAKEPESPQVAKTEHRWTRKLFGYDFKIKVSHTQHNDEPPDHRSANKEIVEIGISEPHSKRETDPDSAKPEKAKVERLEMNEILDIREAPTHGEAIHGVPIREVAEIFERESPLIDKEATSIPPKRSIGARVRRVLGIKAVTPSSSIQRRDSDNDSNSSLTHSLITRVTSVLRYLATLRRTPSGKSSSSLSIGAVPSHRPGLFNRNSTRSVSSSLREIIGGRAPPSTPRASFWYIGLDNRKHFRAKVPGVLTAFSTEGLHVGNPLCIESQPHDNFEDSVDIHSGSQENPVMDKEEEEQREMFKVKLAEVSKDKYLELRLPNHRPDSRR